MGGDAQLAEWEGHDPDPTVVGHHAGRCGGMHSGRSELLEHFLQIGQLARAVVEKEFIR